MALPRGSNDPFISEDDEVDIYSDVINPQAKPGAVIYTVMCDYPFSMQMQVQVRVYHDGLANLEYYRWFGKTGPKHGGYRLSDPADKEIWDRNQEVLMWLSEWGFIELKRIGPEDSEWFATEKLTTEGTTTDG